MPKFTTLDGIEKYLQKNIVNILARDSSIERILAEAMAQSAWENVYDVYDPIKYNRREDDGGLADTRNYEITDFGIKDGKVFITFENLTHGNDNLRSMYLVDTIEEGIQANWNNPNGEWSTARPFVAETARMLNANPTELTNALRAALVKQGFSVR